MQRPKLPPRPLAPAPVCRVTVTFAGKGDQALVDATAMILRWARSGTLAG